MLKEIKKNKNNDLSNKKRFSKEGAIIGVLEE